jgi:hypothetical protein
VVVYIYSRPDVYLDHARIWTVRVRSVPYGPTIREIPIVDRASGDLPCEFGVLNACYDMDDIELLTPKVETSHCKKRRNFSA